MASMFDYIHSKYSTFLTGWFERTSKPTKWIKKKLFHGFGWFWGPTDGWKETSPWTRKPRKFRFSVIVNIYLKPCIHLKSENVKMWILKMKALQAKIFKFLKSCISKWKNGGEWTDLPLRNIPHPHKTTPSPPPKKNKQTNKQTNILNSPKNSKFQKLI